MIDIEKLAREAGFQCLDLKIGEGYEPIKLVQPISSTNIAVELKRLAALVLEEAAKVAALRSNIVYEQGKHEQYVNEIKTLDKAAESIRTITRQLSEGG